MYKLDDLDVGYSFKLEGLFWWIKWYFVLIMRNFYVF